MRVINIVCFCVNKMRIINHLPGLRKSDGIISLKLLISPVHCTNSHQFSSVQSSRVQLFATPWTAARQASLSIINSRSLLKPMSLESVMPSNHLILCRPLLLLPSVFPSIRVFSSESVLYIRCHSGGVSASASVLPSPSASVLVCKCSRFLGVRLFHSGHQVAQVPLSAQRRLGRSYLEPHRPLLYGDLGRAGFASCKPGTVKITSQGGREVKQDDTR